MSRRVLVTGCSGFLGHYLAQFLVEEGHQVFGTYHRNRLALEGVQVILCDLTSRSSVEQAVKKSRPDLIFHLGGQTNIPTSWKDFEGTFQVNVFGTYYLLEAVRESETPSRVVIAGSSSEYGPVHDGVLLDENAPFKPTNPYALSKVSVDHLARAYFKTFGLPVVRVIPFYVIGPRKEPDAPSDFAKAIAGYRRGKIDRLRVGNLNSVRDVIDVRDAVRALWLIGERGEPGTAYNLCTGKEITLQGILQKMLKLSRADLQVVVDPAKLRVGDETRVVGNSERLKQLGWKPTFSIDETLKSILDYWMDKA